MMLATAADHLEAARVMNVSRSNGVQAASIDALIAAMALERGALLLTSDKDYLHIAENIPLDVRYVPSSDS
jgi:predicted nucleic acid-binding protein